MIDMLDLACRRINAGQKFDPVPGRIYVVRRQGKVLSVHAAFAEAKGVAFQRAGEVEKSTLATLKGRVHMVRPPNAKMRRSWPAPETLNRK